MLQQLLFVTCAYQHPLYAATAGTREYMQAEVMPYVQQALEALAVKIQQERLKVSSATLGSLGLQPYRQHLKRVTVHNVASTAACTCSSNDAILQWKSLNLCRIPRNAQNARQARTAGCKADGVQQLCERHHLAPATP